MENITKIKFFIYIILLILIIYLPFLNSRYSKYNEINKEDTFFNVRQGFSIILFILVLIIMIFMSFLIGYIKSNVLRFFTGVFIVCLIFFIIFIFQTSNYFGLYYSYIAFGIFSILIFVMLLITLSVIYVSFMQKIMNQEGLFGFIIKFIFFLPCLFNGFSKYLINEFKMTAPLISLLLIILIILIGVFLYLYWGNINKNITISTTLTKTNTPIKTNYLNNKFNINLKTLPLLPSYLPLNQITNVDIHSTNLNNSNLNYGISIWIYMPQQLRNDISNKLSKNIFYYGDPSTNMRPQISYITQSFANSNNNDTCIITGFGPSVQNTPYTGSQPVLPPGSITFELNSQKWNNLFFNYYDNSMDLYVNGVLERTITSPTPPIYTLTDTIQIGDNNGLNGYICNIAYYTNPLSDYEIINNYNIYMNTNPPIKNN
jgi:hypothetical protein